MMNIFKKNLFLNEKKSFWTFSTSPMVCEHCLVPLFSFHQ